MQIKPFKMLKNTKPLCFADNWIVLYKLSYINIVDAHTGAEIKKVRVPVPFIKRVLSKIKPIHRMLRLGAKNGIYSMGKIFTIIDKTLFSISINDFLLKEELVFEKGSGPLHLTNVEDITSFNNGLYFGDYYGNNSKEPVNITRRNHDGTFEVVYTFIKGQINHIHNLIPDKFNDCVWVLAGDFGDAASIWKAKDNFNTVERVLYGSQQYRSCMAFPTKDGLIYMTDTQFEHNHIRILEYKNKRYISKPIQKVNGSVIYGCTVGNKIVFSTSTEPASDGSSVFDLLKTKQGNGIIKNESHIVVGNLEDGFKTIDVNKKDCLPYGLFQFGTVMFPAGKNPTNKLYSYNVANRKNDLHTEVREL